MAYFSGLNASQSSYIPQADSGSIPAQSTGVVSGGGSQPQGPAPQYSQASMNQLPNSVMQNIAQYNTNPYGSIGAASNQQQGLNNYNMQAQMYGQQPGAYVPWSMQDQSAGGMGLSGYAAPNMFGVGGAQAPQNMQYGEHYGLEGGAINHYNNLVDPYSGKQAGSQLADSYNINKFNPFDKNYWDNAWTKNPGYNANYQQENGSTTLNYDPATLQKNYMDRVNLLYNQYGLQNPNFSKDVTVDQLGKSLWQGANPGQAQGPHAKNWTNRHAYEDYQKFGAQMGYYR